MALAREHHRPLSQLLLAVADDKLMLGHRNSDWTGLGPILEEDIAFSSIAQDEIAHAQALYELAGKLLDPEASADELAFGRSPENYRCAQIVEPGDDFDWAVALIRQLLCDHFDRLRLGRLAKSSYKPLSDLAKRLVAEEQVHVEHADSWVVRLGRGTVESHARLQRALDTLSPLASSLFEPVEGQDALEKASVYPNCLPLPLGEGRGEGGPDPSSMRKHTESRAPSPLTPLPEGEGSFFAQWRDEVSEVLKQANLQATFAPHDPSIKGGRRGVHTPAFAELLDEMCEVYRIEPGAAW